MLSNPWRLILDIILDGYSIIVCLIIAISLLIRNRGNGKLNFWFMSSLYINSIMAVVDILTLLLEGSDIAYLGRLFKVSMFVYYLCSFLILVSFTLFLINFLGNKLIGHIYSIIPPTCTMVYLAFLALTPITGALYMIDDNYIYTRGSYYFVAIILEGALLIQTFILLFVKKDVIEKGKIVPFLVMMFIPLVAQIIQVVFYGLSVINTGFTLSFIIIFANFNSSVTTDSKNIIEVRNKKSRRINVQDNTINSLTNMMTVSEKENGYHIARVCQYVEMIAQIAKKKNIYSEELTDSFITKLTNATLVYDVGKLVVTNGVLKKTEPLTEDEKEEIRNHVPLGEKILKSVLEEYDDKEFVRIAEEVAMCHHEKWNGTGYPRGLSETEIPLSARIISIADVFDALVAPRVYKASISYEEAYVIMEENAGVAFDPLLIEAFLSNKKRIQEINEKIKVKEKKGL